MKNDIEFLKENRIFSGLFNGDAETLLEVATPGYAKRKQYIYQPGDPADAVYWIKSGRVKISKLTEDGREIIVGMFQNGDVFGEMAFVEDKPREYFAEALDDLTYVSIRRSQLFALSRRKPGVIYRFAKLIAERRREVETTLESLLYKGVRERLAGQLLKLSKEYGIEDTRGKLLRIKITHKDLASLIGSSRETVSLTLGDLKRVGLIDVNNDRKIIIRNEKQLSQLT
jgi:CRP/FNR family transcriptional regulator, cyclic AMP receptor protein